MKQRAQKADAVIVVLACVVLFLVYQLSTVEHEVKSKNRRGKVGRRPTVELNSHVKGERYFNFKALPVIILKKDASASDQASDASSGSTGDSSEGGDSSNHGEANSEGSEASQDDSAGGGDDETEAPVRKNSFVSELPLDDVSDLIDFNGNEQGGGDATQADYGTEVPESLQHLQNAAVLILAYNRPDTLTKTVDKLLEAAHSTELKIYISIDGTDPSTVEVIDTYKDQGVHRLDHPRKALGPLKKLTEGGTYTSGKAPGTMYLAAHYKWALNEVLRKRGHTHAIIIEDDMLMSADFLSLFEQTAPLLEADSSLWCVSSWNDNGYKHLELPDDKLFRTSFFPGLGWMLRKQLWEELEPAFPADQWDHWMRSYTTSKGRECIVPFKSRNYNIGSGGANSNPQFFRKYLQNIDVYSGKPVRFRNIENLPLVKYSAYIEGMLSKAKYLQDTALQQTDEEVPEWAAHSKVVAVPYFRERYERLAKQMGLYPSLRASHRYVNILFYKGVAVLLLDKRLSPYLNEEKSSLPVKGLKAVAAGRPGVSCNDVCENMEGGWECAKGQFDFVNQCKVLQRAFGGCSNGCRRDWGKDIPVYEHIGSESQFGGHQCLVTEMIPSCEARHPKTERLCPCVPRGKVQEHKTLQIIPAGRAGMDCHEVCLSLAPKHRCDDAQFHYVNTCQALKAHFSCSACEVNQGKDIPNYVSSTDDANHEKCLTQRAAPTCDGSHKNTKRLCPCVLDE